MIYIDSYPSWYIYLVLVMIIIYIIVKVFKIGRFAEKEEELAESD